MTSKSDDPRCLYTPLTGPNQHTEESSLETSRRECDPLTTRWIRQTRCANKHPGLKASQSTIHISTYLTLAHLAPFISLSVAVSGDTRISKGIMPVWIWVLWSLAQF